VTAKAVYRFVPHTIRHVPEGGVVCEAFCVAHGCEAESGPQGDPDAVLEWCLRHTGRTGHDLFRRAFSDHARVTCDG
jgi:hypothetical protein